MAGFAATIAESQLDDWVLATRKKISKEVTDIITPEHPTFRRLEQCGAIDRQEPGQGPVEDVMYATPDRSTILSRSVDLQDREETPVQGITEAQFDWIMVIETLVIPMYEYLNATSANSMTNFVKRKMKQIDIALQNLMVTHLWNGHVEGNHRIFGISDLVQFDPSSDPTKGAVGRLSVSDLPTWKNVANDYDEEFKQVDAGGHMGLTVIDDANGMLDTYLDCSNNPTGVGPDLMPCNQEFFRFMHNLYRAGLIFRDDQANVQLGQEGFRFHNATIYHDRDVPEPSAHVAAGEGVCFFLNCDSLRWVYASGLEKKWGSMRTLERKTGYAWDQMTQYSMTVNDRRKNGVLFGVQDYTP